MKKSKIFQIILLVALATAVLIEGAWWHFGSIVLMYAIIFNK